MSSPRPLAPRFSTYLIAALLLASAGSASASLHGVGDEEQAPASTEELMRAARRKFGRNGKKYAAFVDEVEQAVEAALAATSWQQGLGDGESVSLSLHPSLLLVQALAQATRASVEGRKNSEATLALLERHPWSTELEFLLGLAMGSEREIPKHDSGFIALGLAPMPPPGYPDLLTNHYLYGLEEVVGWQYGVKSGKRPKYSGRKSKDRPALATELPHWERLRVLLLGTTPDNALFAVPQLTHGIHARLAERRLEDEGAVAPMDDFLTLLDSKWNGFSFEVPETGERVAFVQPVHWLFTDGKGFVFQFPRAKPIAQAGDIPFFSVQTYASFAETYLGETVGFGDFIASNEQARAVQGKFTISQRYLSRYKAVIDLHARAILAPNLRLPSYLAAYDYPNGALPTERKIDYDFDMPRRHALLVWASAGKDPAALADFLHDRLFTREGCGYPGKKGLAVELTLLVREVEDELLQTVVERIARERGGEAVLDTPGYTLGDYEREFSPYAAYRTVDGAPSTAYLAHSFHSFHRPVMDLVSSTARRVVAEGTAE